MFKFIPVPEQYFGVIAARWPLTYSYMAAYALRNGYHLFDIYRVCVGRLVDGKFVPNAAAKNADKMEQNYGTIFGRDMPPTVRMTKSPTYLCRGELGEFSLFVNDILILRYDMHSDYTQYYEKLILEVYNSRAVRLAAIVALLPQPIAEEIAEHF